MTKITKEYVLGIISDTHGLVRPEISKIFKGVDLILHAGDVGGENIISELEEIAPVVAVKGNMDRGGYAATLSETEIVEIGKVSIYMLHDLYRIDLDPAAAGFGVVISGHTHVKSLKKKDGVLYLNPGSAGPVRLDYPVSAAILKINGKNTDVRFITIKA